MGGANARQTDLNEDVLAQLRRVGGQDLVAELMRLYLTHTPERLRRVRRALAEGDLRRVSKAVHSLRSSSATLGAAELATVLAEVEAAADRGDAEVVSRRWPEIEGRVGLLLEKLEERLA